MRMWKRLWQRIDPGRYARRQRRLDERARRELDWLEGQLERERDSASGTADWIRLHNDLYRLRRIRIYKGL